MSYLLLKYTPVQKFVKRSIYMEDHRFDGKKKKFCFVSILAKLNIEKFLLYVFSKLGQSEQKDNC